MNYAAFIITYERAEILKNTIKSLFNQSLPPKEILIVDNSETNETRELIDGLNNPKIKYHRVGYNSGPSGGAYYGLKIMAKTKYDWYYWVDDDNPPEENDLIEKIFTILPKIDIEKCGQIGKIGSRFNKSTGELIRLKDEELVDKIIEVDGIGGGQCKIISAKVAKAGILPEKKLFFGFEDLDIDLKIKKAGFKSYVSGKIFYESRKRSNRLNLESQRGVATDITSLNRQYYSVRSLLTIFEANNYYLAFMYLTFKKLVSIPLSFKHGVKAGRNYAKVIFLAYYHFMKGRYGKIDLNLK
ncbi:glycosyltransferase [uncultured Salegentibacter sp.]|uniref:glycosyltransferase n=1 Tax=uncultured Salegentibacter sp. TaxID=259320 RepID=UPI002596DD13|nr:glycosyltransferase [uncultured Salegentibacter sp.]